MAISLPPHRNKPLHADLLDRSAFVTRLALLNSFVTREWGLMIRKPVNGDVHWIYSKATIRPRGAETISIAA